MNINPGELNKKIKFITIEGGGTDEDGFPLEQVTIIHHEPWAKVTNTSGTELIKSGAEFVEVKTRFLIRYTNKINEDMNILFSDRLYDISYINNYEYLNEYIEVWGTFKGLI